VGVAKSAGLPIPLPLPDVWWQFFGLAFAAAATWAFLLFRFLRFDLRKRGYTERLRSGMMVQIRRGSIDEVRCLEIGRYQGLLPSSNKAPSAGWGGSVPNVPGYASPTVGTLLALKLWWHDPHRPPVVVEHLVVGSAYGIQDQRTQHFLGLAQAYAYALRVPLVGSL
jgi:hypothetical protein